MFFPAKIVKRIRLEKGPILLGRPVATENAVYVGRGMIQRLDARNLRKRWSKYHEDCSPGLVVGSFLIIGDGVTEAALGVDSGEVVWSAQSWGGPLWRGILLRYAPHGVAFVEPSTGEVLDRIEVPGPASFHDLNEDTLLFTIGEDVRIAAAYDLAERKLLWQCRLLEETVNQYQASGDSITLLGGSETFIATKGDVGIFGCSMADGSILWHQRVFVSYDVPFAFQGRVYALSQGFPTRNEFAKFMCFDALTGEKIYETEHKEFLAYRPSRPTVYEDHVYFGSDGGFVFAFRLADGALVWRHRTTGQTWQPAIIEDRLYVTSDDGHLLLFEGKKSLTKTKAETKHG